MIDDIELPELQIGRKALRTFKLYGGHFWPVSIGVDTWKDGTCVAECLADGDHLSPALRCNCGVYGTLSLEHLMRQYPEHATHLVCVIAAEGATILGSRGLRTAAARILAYWTDDERVRKVAKIQFSAAKYHRGLAAMLAAHDLPVLMEDANELRPA